MDNYKLIGFNRKECVSANIMLPLRAYPKRDYRNALYDNPFWDRLLCAVLIGLSIALTITGVIPINFLNLTIPFAIFIYLLSYITSDILNEFYRVKLARKSINLTFASNAIFCAILFISSKATPF